MAKITTVTNPLTGQPAQVDQLDHTAQEIDDGIGFESTDYPGCYYRIVSGVVEWFNPPMILGAEYRTTERYMGNPVFVRLVDCGTFTASASPTETRIAVDTVANMGANFRLISCEGVEYISVIDQITIPNDDSSTPCHVKARCWTDSQNIRQWGVVVYFEKATEPYHVYANVKYTY